MKILSITTSSSVCAVCLLEDTTVIKELTLNNEKTHSENLMPLIAQLFEETSTSLNNIDYIACDIGPGSFTGIRIGIASVKAMAETYNIQVIPVSSLEALSYNVERTDKYICSLIDARNNNAYSALFNENHIIISDFTADDIDRILRILPNRPIYFVGNGATLHREKILEKFNDNASFIDNNLISASKLGISAYSKILKGKYATADKLLPLYLRKSQAERMLENE